jgi:hypothetical protein
MNSKQRRWAEQEDRLECSSPRTAWKLLGGTRSYQCIKVRRQQLRYPDRYKSDTVAHWTEEMTALLRAKYSEVEHVRDLLPLLPGINEAQLRGKAAAMKLRRRFTGYDDRVLFMGHAELVDQIRLRAHEDGFTFYSLDQLLKTGSYFKHWKERKKVNLLAVARAVEFFGGTLVIDWRDRKCF